jgi:hypothetical protein
MSPGILRGTGETDLLNKLEAESLVSDSLTSWMSTTAGLPESVRKSATVEKPA